MGVEIRPEFHPPTGDIVFQAEGKVLADRIRSIHSYSKKRGITPITDFLDNRDMPEDEDFDDWKATRTDWYSAADGLQAVRALMDAVRSDPQVAKRWNKEDPDAVETLLNDLQELVRCLDVAKARGVQFRLDIAM